MAERHLMWIQLIGGTHLNVKSVDLRPRETDIAACVWIYLFRLCIGRVYLKLATPMNQSSYYLNDG